MSILYHYYNSHTGTRGKLDSPLSMSIALIVLSLILGIAFMYASYTNKNNKNAEASLESSLDGYTIELTSPSKYPEPGTLSY